VLYVEFEDINGADKIMKEVEGHDVESDFLTPNAEARQEWKREVELKLILSKQLQGMEFHGEHPGRKKPFRMSRGSSVTRWVPAVH